jgi:glycosyltransferase involved in cell wall biosynthesis
LSLSHEQHEGGLEEVAAMKDGERLGVSLVICCHNSAQQLLPTFEHLKAQQVPPAIRWEVIVVDNGCTDDTVKVARRCWPENFPVPLRVVAESKLGLSHARERGFREAQFEIVAFVDDDNWISEGWVAAVSDALSSDPGLGGVGSLVYPVFESAPAPWLLESEVRLYALRFEPEDDTRYLVGAGMAIRKAAWQELIDRGFRWRLIDRKGKNLSTCGDTETSCALRLGGWRLRADDRMRLLHYLPARRLTWQYYRRLLRAFYASHSMIDLYYASADGIPLSSHLGRPWQRLALSSLIRSFLRPRRLWKWMFSGVEGDPEVIEQERDFGQLFGLLSFRSEYTDLVRQIREGKHIFGKDSAEYGTGSTPSNATIQASTSE